ncbi:MAG: hypothetical protein COS88_03965 [Chloroflexi bacterium CG07_land_8_20_14_0_80_51_10]|nr:MAG: hypothetical protein COS88_03965 [Chloroflexi bacterium CG07_land_8_20_14_0_80_51_10]
MTQLVGVICENREEVILISDRMVTTADGSLAFEHEPKVEFIVPSALVLMAGSIHEPELITDARSAIKGKTPLREIADIL